MSNKSGARYVEKLAELLPLPVNEKTVLSAVAARANFYGCVALPISELAVASGLIEPTVAEALGSLQHRGIIQGRQAHPAWFSGFLPGLSAFNSAPESRAVEDAEAAASHLWVFLVNCGYSRTPTAQEHSQLVERLRRFPKLNLADAERAALETAEGVPVDELQRLPAFIIGGVPVRLSVLSDERQRRLSLA